MNRIIAACVTVVFANPVAAATLLHCGKVVDSRAARMLGNTTLIVDGGTPQRLEVATLLGMQDKLGTLEAGKFADIVAVPQDPTADIKTMEHVSFVMKRGSVYKEPSNGATR